MQTRAVARAPSTSALDGFGTPASSHALRIAEAMPETSVLNPASIPAEGTTVFTAPTATASGSVRQAAAGGARKTVKGTR